MKRGKGEWLSAFPVAITKYHPLGGREIYVAHSFRGSRAWQQHLLSSHEAPLAVSLGRWHHGRSACEGEVTGEAGNQRGESSLDLLQQLTPLEPPRVPQNC